MDYNKNVLINEKKEKIREKYKGIDTDSLDFIPAIAQENFHDDSKIKRVGVYARVSTGDPRQTSSYELQKNHYHDLVKRRPDWELVDIYADEGISGTSLKHRDSFIKMIDDCHSGKIDLIVTKSVSRFARNVVDCIGYVRALADMRPPIGVFFETENIYTLDANSELSLSFISTLAQEESHTKSEIMNASIEMRFRRGIFLTPVLLGYDHDENGNLVVNESEAKTVKLCFYLYYFGFSSQYISDLLIKLKRPTKKGNLTWTPSAVISLLQNERYCGDVLARKTWTPNYLNHKSRKNNQNRNQYRQRNHHKPIISRELFIAVQHIIANRRYGRQSYLPNLKVVSEGELKGFVLANLKWASFNTESYINASMSVYDKTEQIQFNPLDLPVDPRSFNLQDYEIIRGEFFTTRNRPMLFINNKQLSFSSYALNLFPNYSDIEILIHPEKYQLLIHPISEPNKNSTKWRYISNGKIHSKIISGTAFLSILYNLCGWDASFKYRIIGFPFPLDDPKFLLFDLHNTEIMISNETYQLENNINYFSTRNYIKAYPIQWNKNFGQTFYEQSQDFLNCYSSNDEIIYASYAAIPNFIDPIEENRIRESIDELIEEIREENVNG